MHPQETTVVSSCPRCRHIPLLALVPIRATDPVAIPVAHSLRVNLCNSWAKKIFPNNSWAKIFRGISVAPAKDNFKLSQVVPVVVTKIDTLIDLGEDKCLEGTTERSDSNRGRSPREEAIALILPGRQYATGPASIIQPHPCIGVD